MTDALAGVTLDHGSPVPLYHQAAQALEAAIEDGRLPRGSKLGGEVELATRSGSGRPTMRAAMKQLVDKGLLLRRRGIGTMVAPRPVRRAAALTSLYDDLKEAGRAPRATLPPVGRGLWRAVGGVEPPHAVSESTAGAGGESGGPGTSRGRGFSARRTLPSTWRWSRVR